MRLLSAVAGIVLSALPAGAAVTCHADQAIFATQEGPVQIQVEIAADEASRARGLMFRKELPPLHGMLFIYERPQQVSFWMRNTLIPLDLLFLDEVGVIRHIHPMAKPLDETPIPGAAPLDPKPQRLMVLEIAGGEAARLGLRPGLPMAHPAIAQSRAALPCK